MGDLQLYLLIFFRSFGFFLILPFLEAGAGVFLKAILSLLTAFIFWPTMTQVVDMSDITALTCIQEIIIGTILGTSILLPIIAAEIFGDIFDTGRGMTLGQIVDPFNGAQLSYTSFLTKWFFITLFFTSGGLMILLNLLRESFKIIPCGAVDGGAIQSLATNLLKIIPYTMSAVFSLGLIAMFLYIAVELVFLFLSKVIPNLSFQSEAFFLKSVLGYGMLYIALQWVPVDAANNFGARLFAMLIGG